MSEFAIRKVAVLTEEIFHEGGPVAKVPRRRAAAMAVVNNPFAGRYVEDLQSALEHGALWHVPGGYAMRERLGDAKAIVPSAKKVGAFGSRLDVPLGHINAAYVRSHFDAMEVGISDGPRPNEILFCLAMTCGPRVHDRMGGLAATDIKAWDGLR
ncbi:MAG: amino acid synthesis family protein [Mesorhizobium sp.]|nr:MAG: amino acid synthesis family protein [Mesorhizobium sp.]